jgi:hypothetical protein
MSKKLSMNIFSVETENAKNAHSAKNIERRFQ